MPVIAVLNQKGGVGKSTLSTHLARGFQLAGSDVLLVDSDPQGSARDWAAANENQPVAVVGLDRPSLDKDIKKVAGRRDLIIIDGAARLEAMIVSAIKAADLVLIPVQPSPYDIWAASELVDLVKQRIELTDGALRAAFIINRAITGTRIGREVGEAIAGYELPVLNSVIHQRILFATSAATGSTVLDDEPNSEAANEIQELLKEIRGML